MSHTTFEIEDKLNILRLKIAEIEENHELVHELKHKMHDNRIKNMYTAGKDVFGEFVGLLHTLGIHSSWFEKYHVYTQVQDSEPPIESQYSPLDLVLERVEHFLFHVSSNSHPYYYHSGKKVDEAKYLSMKLRRLEESTLSCYPTKLMKRYAEIIHENHTVIFEFAKMLNSIGVYKLYFTALLSTQHRCCNEIPGTRYLIKALLQVVHYLKQLEKIDQIEDESERLAAIKVRKEINIEVQAEMDKLEVIAEIKEIAAIEINKLEVDNIEYLDLEVIAELEEIEAIEINPVKELQSVNGVLKFVD